MILVKVPNIKFHEKSNQWVTPVAYRGGVWGVQPPPEIPKTLQNRAKLNPTVKTVKNYWI